MGLLTFTVLHDNDEETLVEEGVSVCDDVRVVQITQQIDLLHAPFLLFVGHSIKYDLLGDPHFIVLSVLHQPRSSYNDNNIRSAYPYRSFHGLSATPPRIRPRSPFIILC